ncbi:carboxymuconolactone decarboxylase family protein [Streptomyces sp. NBC_01498]|uniref:carboxymuconolactone decarboxylase family protein n=1 Tax=Streptomyces sp. NBC_01498 TaxID=2975870 RepID=UPI002E7B6F6E|nr:carboxymuconolactone decarboxylase family protein [Streptomyces sp. NBC_01498]WTL25049.1 carboxymuconolactone decarboxylase family protein [Streptomyces sp. NBC_01498]
MTTTNDSEQATTATTAHTHGTDGTHGTDRAPEHRPRMAWAALAPEVFRAMVGLDRAVRRGVDPVLYGLVKIRASQLNHCAYCLDMHTQDALAAGESARRIVQLTAWEEARHFYSAKEIAAIELTEAITVLTDGFVPDAVYERAAAHFEEAELAHLIAAITVINSWNRFAVTTRMVPGHHTPGSLA